MSMIYYSEPVATISTLTIQYVFGDMLWLLSLNGTTGKSFHFVVFIRGEMCVWLKINPYHSIIKI